MAYSNKLTAENVIKLRKALINWALETDGNCGATCDIINTIPWMEEMGFEFWQEYVADEIDAAIGTQYDEDDKEWDVGILADFISLHNAHIEYRNKFRKFIEEKVNNICEAYKKAVDKLNASLNKKYFWVLESECYTERSHTEYSTKEECYEAMRKAVSDKVLWNIEWDDYSDNKDKIDINIIASRDKITVKSYSGTYVWSIIEV